MRRLWIVPVTIGLLAFGGLINVAGADIKSPSSASTPRAFTSYVGSTSISYDSKGDPVQASLKLTGLPQSSGFKLCVEIASRPSYNDINYGVQCKTFSFANAKTTSVTWGTNFTWGGPAEYKASWSVPPTADPITTANFRWTAQGSTALSPCPPDPYLMQGVWQPSRLTIIDRCYTSKGDVTGNYREVSGDKDYTWFIRSGSITKLHTEYMTRDKGRLRDSCAFDCSMPTLGEIWELTGVLVCDTNHGHKEFHPVFQAVEYGTNGTTVLRTLLSGPQYSIQKWAGPYPEFDPKPC